MKRFKYYIYTAVAALSIIGCSEEELVKYPTQLEIIAEIPQTRTAYTTEGSITKVEWVEGDNIGLFTKNLNNTQLQANNAGSSVSFSPINDITLEEGDSVFAYYPYSFYTNNSEDNPLIQNTQQYIEAGLANLDFMFASGQVVNNKVELKFQHTLSFIRFKLPTEYITPKAEMENTGFVIKSRYQGKNYPVSAYLIYDSPGGKIKTARENERIYYTFPENYKDSTEVTCIVSMLPQPEGAKIEFYRYDMYGGDDFLFEKSAPEGGLQAGHIYNLTFDSDNIEYYTELDRSALIAFYNSTNGDEWINNTNWCSDKPLNEWYGISTNSTGTVRDIILEYNNLTGTIPPEIGNLTYLRQINVGGNRLTGSIPSEIGKLKHLERAIFNVNELSGRLPVELAECDKLHTFDILGNKITGSIPVEYAEMFNRDNFDFGCVNNTLSGIIDNAILETKLWKYQWGNIISSNNFLPPTYIHAPELSAIGLDGDSLKTNYKNDKLTILFYFEFSCPTSQRYIPLLNEWHKKYADKGLRIIGELPTIWNENSEAQIKDYGIEWDFFPTDNPTYNYSTLLSPPYDNGASNRFSKVLGVLAAFDSEKNLVFSNMTHTDDFIENKLKNIFAENKNEFYESSDYSKDGTVVTLQEATVGKGIDLVLMGDAYSDRLIADGTYDRTMRKAMDNFFNEEPFKSFRNMFNVYYVNVVSPNEVYDDGSVTALSTYHTTTTEVGGSEGMVIKYTLNAISPERVDEALIAVTMNSTVHGGTCYMVRPVNGGEVANGTSIGYLTLSGSEEQYAELMHHEVGGHGFGKLGDEYYYSDNGSIIQTNKWNDVVEFEKHGWYRNISLSYNPETVKWRHFIEDERYAAEQIGIFEGAQTYSFDAYRPTLNSIMNDNTGGFNAPSREIIYQRLHKLAYGDEWSYDYETFVEYDVINRRKSHVEKPRKHPVIHTAPPVILNRSWRELVKE